MFFSSRSAQMKERTPLPPRMAGLLREAWDVRMDALCNERESLVFEDLPA